MQYESEYNLTFHIYFSGLLEVVLLVQQRTVRVHCAACSSPWGRKRRGKPRLTLCGRSSWQVCALLICVFINYVCVCVCVRYACVCAGYSSQTVWAISRWVSSLTLWTCVFVCVWGSGVMWCETGKWRIGSVCVCVCVCARMCVIEGWGWGWW